MRLTFLLLVTLLLFSCNSNDSITDNDNVSDFNEEQIAGLFDAASVIKDINQQMVSLVMQYPNIHGLDDGSGTHAPAVGTCPDIYPDPNDIHDFFPASLSFNFVNEGEGCVPTGSAIRYKGIFFLDIYANVCLPGGAFRFHGNNFWLGDNLNLSVDSIDVTQNFKGISGDTLIFDTEIEKLICLNNGLLTENRVANKHTAVKGLKGGISKYVDRNHDTDLNDFETLVDDVVVFEFEELIAYCKDTGNEMKCKNGKLFFGVACTCPMAGTFEIDGENGGIIDFGGNGNCIDGAYTFNGQSYNMLCN